MHVLRTEEAVGTVLCHDITKILPGEYKGPAYKKGHIIISEDIPELLKMGKEHVYVWKPEPGMVHENDAAIRIARVLGRCGLIMSEPREGKVDLRADADGICMINENLLMEVNQIDDIIVAARNNLRPVKSGEIVAGTRVVPLLIPETKLQEVEAIATGSNVIKVKPYNPCKVGIVTIGNEIYHHRIEDKFGPVVSSKVQNYGCQVMERLIVADDVDQIKNAILSLITNGAKLVLATGGMSVDPDDVTPLAIKAAGARVVTYGAPVLPGAMLMVAYLGEAAIMGLPGCVMYNKITAFDLLLPVILADEPVTKTMVARMGMGGLCLHCPVCHYPACSFGTGL